MQCVRSWADVRLRKRDQTSRADSCSAWLSEGREEAEAEERKGRESLDWRARNSEAVVEEVWCCKRASGGQTLLKPGRECVVVEESRRSKTASVFRVGESALLFLPLALAAEINCPARSMRTPALPFARVSNVACSAPCKLHDPACIPRDCAE